MPCCRFRVRKTVKIRVKNREPVPAYAMADADRDSDLGDDSPVVSRLSVYPDNCVPVMFYCYCCIIEILLPSVPFFLCAGL